MPITLTLDLPDNAEDLYEAANGSALTDALTYHALSWLQGAEQVLMQRAAEPDKATHVATEITKYQTEKAK